MKKYFNLCNVVLLGLAVAVCLPLSAQQRSRKEPKYKKDYDPNKVIELSENKIIFIRDMVKAYVDFKDDITDQSIINEIYDKIEKNFPIQIKKKPDNRTIQEIRKAAAVAIKQDKQFAKEEKEYRKDLEVKAANIYKTYKAGDKVTLVYTRGANRYRVSGTFYRFNGRSVSLGMRSVPYYDLIEEDKIKVNPYYARKKQNEYVQAELKDYLDRRRDALLAKEVELERKQLKYNLDSGFVRYAEMWRHPIQVINIRLIESIESDPRFAGKVTGLNLDSINRIQIKRKDAIDVKELNERIQAKKEDAARQVGSIDSEQGFLNTVFWGFSREEIKYVLESQGINHVAGKEFDRATGSDQQILENRLYYEKNRLVKVVSIYTIDHFDGFIRLKKNMVEKYGPDDREKNKDYVRPGDPLKWTGVITDGYLYAKQNPKTGLLDGQVTMTLTMVPLSERRNRALLLKKGNK